MLSDALAGNEARLIAKLQAIEALFAGAATAGERDAAGAARDRIRARLEGMLGSELPEEFQFSMNDLWSRRVFVALLRRYGIRPYRYPRQRRTTVVARMPRRFLDETLWPQYLELSETLRAYLSQVTDRVVTQVLDAGTSDADVVASPPEISAPRPAPAAPPSPPVHADRSRRKRARRKKRRSGRR